MIGAFYQPQLKVIADLDTARHTCPIAKSQRWPGRGDQVRPHRGRRRFSTWIDSSIVDALRARVQVGALAHAVRRSCEIKACGGRPQDERESGLRAILNFGHTFGHAIEAGLGYGQLAAR